MMDFVDLVKKRKSIRSFASAPVSRDIVEKILDIAVYAPTNCNQQLWNFIVIDDPVVKERIVKEAAGNTMFRRAPSLIALTYDGWNYKEAIQGASLALGHLLLAAQYYGISASPVNSYGADSRVKKILNIPDHEIICCFVTLGFPDDAAEKAPHVPRKDIKSVTHWNIFEKKSRAPFTYNPNDWSLGELTLHQKHYCRKTSLGKEMDLAGSWERQLVTRVLESAMPPYLDLFSYDGGYLKNFPKSEIETIDLTEEISTYTKRAAEISAININNFYIYNERGVKLPGFPNTITLIYKAERLSDEVLGKLFHQVYETLPRGGEFIIISRRRFSLFSIFVSALRLLFGNDVRKTGIYAFFGPYRPIRVDRVLKLLRLARFTEAKWNGYMLIPGFFVELYHIVVQYIRSEGSSYLHRDRWENFISKLISSLVSLQGFTKCGVIGSVAVIRCRK